MVDKAELALLSLHERRLIEDNKMFARLAEKTQVMIPLNGRNEVIKNRATHSFEVATSALMIAANIAKHHNVGLHDIDHQHALYNACLLHDIGHTALSHEGQKILHKAMVNMGLLEGFSDNNNNLVVIENNDIDVRDYTKASIIKYPERLYDYQKATYLPILAHAIKLDKEHFKTRLGIILSGQQTTLTCQIMDQADRNSYTFSDLTDALCMGNAIPPQAIHDMTNKAQLPNTIMPLVHELIDVIEQNSKSQIKRFLSDCKAKANQAYTLNEQGLVCVDRDILLFREMVNKLTWEFYIKPSRINNPAYDTAVRALKYTVLGVANGHFLPSKKYKEKFESAQSKEERLRCARDLIGEFSDWYVINTYCEFHGIDPATGESLNKSMYDDELGLSR